MNICPVLVSQVQTEYHMVTEADKTGDLHVDLALL